MITSYLFTYSVDNDYSLCRASMYGVVGTAMTASPLYLHSNTLISKCEQPAALKLTYAKYEITVI